MDTPSPEPENPTRSMFMPLLWVFLALVVSVGACAGVGLSANDSESAGVFAAQVSAFPLGFVLSAALGGLVVHFAVKRATRLLRTVAPMGCGCLGGFGVLALVMSFFAFIFPAL